jgi:molecular chaperone GrpE
MGQRNPMPDSKRQGAFSADIPEDAVAEALAAVERRARPETVLEVEPPGGAAPAGSAGPGPHASGVEQQLRAELELSQEQARKVFAQLQAEHERLLRTAADLENTRKRAARERDEAVRHGNERLVKELLPALDALERALAAAPPGDPLVAGVELTRRLLEEALARFGVKGFSARGERFDPRLHEALMTIQTADAAPGTVLEEQHRGFFLHERLLRPAAVVVAAALAEASAEPLAGARAPSEGH